MAHKVIFSPTSGNHTQKIAEFYDEHPELLVSDQFLNIVVRHDDWCQIHWDNVCNCDPEVELATDDSGEEKSISTDMVLIDEDE